MLYSEKFSTERVRRKGGGEGRQRITSTNNLPRVIQLIIGSASRFYKLLSSIEKIMSFPL